MSARQRWRLMISGQEWSFRQNLPVGPDCFYRMYHNSQASLRLSSSALRLPAPSPVVLHLQLSSSHQPRFHRPDCLALNSLTSFNPEFIKLLKLYVSEQTCKKGFAANNSLSLISSEQRSLPAECPSIKGLCSKTQNTTIQRRRDLPQFLPHHVLAMFQEFLHGPLHGHRKVCSRPMGTTAALAGSQAPGDSYAWEPLHPLVLMKQLTWRRERAPLLQGPTERPPKEAARSQQQGHRRDPMCACFGSLSCQELEEKSCISVTVVGTGWGTDFPLSWKDFKTSYYQKVYKGWDFKSVLREAKNLLEINGN